MATLELKINLLSVRQGLLSDGRGEWRNDAVAWHAITDLRHAEKSLPIRIEARSTDTDRSDATTKRWAFLLNAAASRRLRDGVLRPFESNDVASDIPRRLQSKSETILVEVDESSIEKFHEDHELHVHALRSFKYAIGCVRRFAEKPPPPGFPEGDEAFSMLSFIQESLDAGDQGFLYGWNDEKLSGIRTYMQELRTRKNRRHPAYERARDYILSNTSCFAPPDAWVRRPPTINPEILAGARV